MPDISGMIGSLKRAIKQRMHPPKDVNLPLEPPWAPRDLRLPPRTIKAAETAKSPDKNESGSFSRIKANVKLRNELLGEKK